MTGFEKAGERSVTRIRAQRLLRLRGRAKRPVGLTLEGTHSHAVTVSEGKGEGEDNGLALSCESERLLTRVKKPLFSFLLPTCVYGETDTGARKAILCVFSVLPEAARRAIEGAVRGRGRELEALEEIRLSLYSECSIVLMGREYPCPISLAKEDFALTVRALCHGTPFSYRSELAEGYLPFTGGVRVGAVGEAHYGEGGELTGVSDIHTLIFRIPHKAPEGASIERICHFLLEHMRRGCLIFGGPREGKTTLLRALAKRLSTGEAGRRVAVIDTRREFSFEDADGGRMDLLMGYQRTRGAAIALRTLSPGYIAMDEVGSCEDVEAIRGVLASGAALLATAHAHSIRDVGERRFLRMLLEDGAFDYLLGIERAEGGHRLSLYRV